MLHRLKDLKGYKIGATDGIIGHVKDFYFDDQAWVIRYLVVETDWFLSQRVLISPIAISQPNWPEKIFPAAITQEQVRRSPNINTDKPVSRQHELAYFSYSGYPYYPDGVGSWATSADPGMLWGGGDIGLGAPGSAPVQSAVPDVEKDGAEWQHHGDPHLRSGNEITTYDVHATDGDIGHVQGLLIEEKSWAIRYLIVNTSNWWLGRQVLVAPQWIESVSWDDRKASLRLSRDAVKRAPAYTAGTRMDRDEEARIHDHYGRSGYWARDVQLENPEFHTVPTVPSGAIGAEEKHHAL